jgi:hypothetical protein
LYPLAHGVSHPAPAPAGVAGPTPAPHAPAGRILKKSFHIINNKNILNYFIVRDRFLNIIFSIK